jgi:hypothetical protein
LVRPPGRTNRPGYARFGLISALLCLPRLANIRARIDHWSASQIRNRGIYDQRLSPVSS